MKQVVFIVHRLFGGGTQKYVTDIASFLSTQKMKVKVNVIVLSNDFTDLEERRCEFPFVVHQLDQDCSKNKLIFSFNKMIKLLGVDMPIDAIFANTFASYKLLSQQTVIPVDRQFYVVHADYYSMYYRWYRLFKNFKRTMRYQSLFNEKKIITGSRGVLENLLTKIKVSPKKSWVISPPINFLEIQEAKDDDINAYGLPEKFILVLGGLTRLKRVNLAIELLKYLEEDLHLVVVGDGCMRGDLEKQALAFSSRVHFLGYLSNPYPVIKKSQFLVSMSRSEGFSLVLIEAMALGVLPLTIASAGPVSILSEQFSECLIEDSRDCVHLMSQKINKPPKYNKKDLASVASKYDIKYVSQQYMELIEGVGCE